MKGLAKSWNIEKSHLKQCTIDAAGKGGMARAQSNRVGGEECRGAGAQGSLWSSSELSSTGCWSGSAASASPQVGWEGTSAAGVAAAAAGSAAAAASGTGAACRGAVPSAGGRAVPGERHVAGGGAATAAAGGLDGASGVLHHPVELLDSSCMARTPRHLGTVDHRMPRFILLLLAHLLHRFWQWLACHGASGLVLLFLGRCGVGLLYLLHRRGEGQLLLLSLWVIIDAGR